MVKYEPFIGKKNGLTHTLNHVNYQVNKHNLKYSTIFYLKNQQKFSVLVGVPDAQCWLMIRVTPWEVEWTIWVKNVSVFILF